MMGEALEMAFIFVVFIGGIFLGSSCEREEHRQYCDCKNCKRWRNSRKQEAERITAEAEKKEFRAP